MGDLIGQARQRGAPVFVAAPSIQLDALRRRPDLTNGGSSHQVRFVEPDGPLHNPALLAQALVDFVDAHPEGPAPLGIGEVTHAGRDAEALGAFVTATVLRDGAAEAWYHVGTAATSLAAYPLALRALERATSLAPDDADARYALGLARWKSGERARATPDFEAAVRMDPKLAAGWERLKALSSLPTAASDGGGASSATPHQASSHRRDKKHRTRR